MSGDQRGRKPESASAAAGKSGAAAGKSATPAGQSVASARPSEPGAISRRGALKVIATGAALGAAAACTPEDAARSSGSAHESLSGFNPLPPSNPKAAGTATDPDMLSPVIPWETVLTDEEMRLVTALADVIIPADDRSPAAGAVGVADYVNEFVSAPGHEDNLTVLRGGLAWLNRTAQERFGAADFPALALARKHEICDEICFEPDAPADLKPQARFFDQFRDMVSTGFWTTEEGMRDIGYMGNIPLPSFDGPPAEVLERLGLAEEDLV